MKRLDVNGLIERCLKALKVDYVVDEGTSSIWTYRKWASGVAECWGIWHGSLTHYSTAGGFYGYYTSITYPTDLFVAGSEPVVTYQPTVNGGFAMPATHFMSGPVSANYYALASASGTQDVHFSIQVKGRWK